MAFQHLTTFINSIQSEAVVRKREFVQWLCERVFEEPFSADGLLPAPLSDRVIVPVLDQWRAAEPQSAVPARWLGVLFTSTGYAAMRAASRPPDQQGGDLLQESLRIDPADQIALHRLVECWIGRLDFNAHHLPDAYLGDSQKDLEMAHQAEVIVMNLSGTEQQKRLTEELFDARQLIIDWLDCKEAGVDLVDWCRQRGREFRPLTRVYVYDPPTHLHLRRPVTG